MTYRLIVTFTRDEHDDANVIDVEHATDDQLIQQLRKELQDAFDHGHIAGSFNVDRVER